MTRQSLYSIGCLPGLNSGSKCQVLQRARIIFLSTRRYLQPRFRLRNSSDSLLIIAGFRRAETWIQDGGAMVVSTLNAVASLDVNLFEQVAGWHA